MNSPYVPNLTKQGLYDPQFERDACGVGLVASVKGARSHEIVTMGLEVLRNLGHRGACGADPETGDGAGVLMQMPHEFFAREAESLGFELPPAGGYAVGMVFLPPDAGQREQCEREIERVVADEGLRLLGWRDVPVSPDAIGRMARAVMPVIRQFFVARPDGIAAGDAFALELYLARRRIENSVARAGLSDSGHFYISSMSDRQIVYKGLVMAHQLESFFHDLDDGLITTAYVLVHSRFSTNTLGSWRLAHPFRYIIHNGEINTIRGNVNWMMAREGMFSSPEMGDRIDELFPIVSSDQSDTASFDNALELLLATGPVTASRADDDDPGGLGRPHCDGAGQEGLLRLPLQDHGAVGRPRADHRRGRGPRVRSSGPQRAEAVPLPGYDRRHTRYGI